MVHGEFWTVKELFVTPNEYIYWCIQIVMYPFMTRLVAGAFVLSSLYHVFGKVRRVYSQPERHPQDRLFSCFSRILQGVTGIKQILGVTRGN